MDAATATPAQESAARFPVPPIEISNETQYETRYIEVNGSRLAYVEAGAGDPILFLHGNPTSKYQWRNIMPWMEGHGRVITPDLIGMSESDKPDIKYLTFRADRTMLFDPTDVHPCGLSGFEVNDGEK